MPCPKQTCINAWYIRKILGRFPARLPALPCRLPAPPRHASGQPFHNAGMDRERRGTVPASVSMKTENTRGLGLRVFLYA